VAGLLAGSAAQAGGRELTQIIQEPVYERQVIGFIPRTSQYSQIPRDQFEPGYKLYYSDRPGAYNSDSFRGSERVVRSVFTGDFKPVETTDRSNFFNPVTGAIAGTAIGAGLGFGVGVASGVLMRMAGADGEKKSERQS
jgi:hypothetical protein